MRQRASSRVFDFSRSPSRGAPRLGPSALLAPALVLAALAALGACSATSSTSGSGNAGNAGGAGGSVGGAGGASGGAGGAGGELFGGMGGSMGPFLDFPAEPLVEAGAPAEGPALFGDPGAGAPSGGPCVTDPQDGALLPRNWLRPRFAWTPAGGQNLYELRVHAESQVHDLVVYTSATEWTMPAAMWAGLREHSSDEPLEVTLRAGVYDGATLSELAASPAQTLTIAPAEAAGSIVYWTTSSGSALKGFLVGDEDVVTVLEPAQVDMPTTPGAEVTCVGCHTSTPDGKLASFVAQAPWSNVLASVESATAGDAPAFLGAGAQAFLTSEVELGIHAYSGAHWQDGDRVMITPRGQLAASELVWVDLEATSPGEGQAFGVLARTGDPLGAGAPAWSHDGERIVYVSTDAQYTGRLDWGVADLWQVPYAGGLGGAATPLPGLSDPSVLEFYPALSSDDSLVALNRLPAGELMYDNPETEIWVAPSTGGSPIRLSANDPPECTGQVSPGITNSWPKWAPEASTVGGRTYYWLIFSSRRGGGNPQLFLAPLVLEGGQLTSYPALYLWNQPPGENNHTPAWDVFQIPPVPPPA
jgi:hypothetical protein